MHRRTDVQDIYNSVTDALLKNAERKFVSAEMAFFERWWQDQLPPRRNSVRRLIRRGQYNQQTALELTFGTI